MNNHAPHVVFTFKGILTGAENWGDIFRRWAMNHARQLAVEEVEWGTLDPLRMYASRLMPLLNWHRQDRCAAFMRSVLKFYGAPRFTILAHSFGTFLAHGMLWRHPDLRPRNLVLIGSVLSEFIRRTRLREMLARGQIGRVLNVWSPNDTAIRLGSFGPFGKAGSQGFRDVGVSDRVFQLKTEEEHSTYFWTEFRETYFTRFVEFIEADPIREAIA